MRIRALLTVGWCVLATELAVAQLASPDNGARSETKAGQGTPITMSASFSMDGGRDRLAIIELRRGHWVLQSVNRVRPDGQSAFSLLRVGRTMRASRRLDGLVSLGPLRTYENHAWDEAVLGTNVTIHGERFQATLSNDWAFPTASSGYFFDSHAQTFTGLPRLPKWVGVNLMEGRNKNGWDRIFVGPLFTKRRGGITFSAFPYWDTTRERADLRVRISCVATVR